MIGAMLVGAESITDTNKWYPTNRAPLKRTKFVMLPVTTAKPLGWLLQELRLYEHGLTGHLFELDAGSQDDIATFIKNSKWRNDTYTGDRWEAGPYYLNGLIPLAYILNDTRLITECQNWINTMIAHKSDWFANVSGDDIWASSEAWQALRSWFEATGERAQDTANFYTLTRNYFNLINGASWGTQWAWSRADENFLALQWFHRRTRASNIPTIASGVKAGGCNWTNLYNTMMSGTNDLRNPQGWYYEAHVVNQAMAVKFGSAYWPFPASSATDSQVAVNAYAKMVKYHGQMPGNISGDESIAGLKAWHGTETCAIVEQMYSLENMLETFGKVDWADKLEYLTYNHFPGKLTPDGWNRQYHSQVNQVLVNSAARSWMSSGNDANIYGNFNTQFRCCTVNLNQGWPKFVVNSWMATHDNGLVAVVYAPTTVTAKVGSGTTAQIVTINETTEYPFNNTVTFTVSTSAPVAFPLVVRVPQWGAGTSVTAPASATVTGSGTATNLSAEQWVTISNTWNNGDMVTVTLPFKVRVEKWFQNGSYSGTTETFSNPGMVVCRGPLVFALRIATTWTNNPYTGCMGAARWSLTSDGKWNYALCVDTTNADSVERSFQVVEQSIDAKYPFGARGDKCYDSASNTFINNAGDVPLYLRAKAKRVASWGLSNNSAGDPPASPITTLGAVAMEDVQLIPYGCTRLRTTVFPWEFDRPQYAVSTLNSLKWLPEAGALDIHVAPHGVVFTVNKEFAHRINIVNMSGKMVKSFAGTTSARYEIPRGAIASGMYIVHSKIGSRVQSEKLMVN
jgi:hypothetical protein